MTGKSHLVCGVSTVGLAASAEHFLLRVDIPYKKEVVPVVKKIEHFMFHPSFLGMPDVVTYILCGCLFLVGLLLPDIDNKNSMLGRHIHLPVEHRTIMHAIWIPLGLFVVSIWVPILFWLAFGYFLHLFADAFSMSGICYLWPLTRYRHFGDGGTKAKKHLCKFYYTGSMSEYVMVVIWFLLCLSVTWFEFDLLSVVKSILNI